MFPHRRDREKHNRRNRIFSQKAQEITTKAQRKRESSASGLQALGAGLPISARRRFFPLWPARRGESHVRLVFDAASADVFAPELAFLAGRGVPRSQLTEATRRSALNGTEAVAELVALGFDRKLYWSMLADELGLAFVEDISAATPLANAGLLATEAVRAASSMLVRMGEATLLVLAPRPDEIALLKRHLAGDAGARRPPSHRNRRSDPRFDRKRVATRRSPTTPSTGSPAFCRRFHRAASGRPEYAGTMRSSRRLLALALVAPLTTLERGLAALHALLPELQLLEARRRLPSRAAASRRAALRQPSSALQRARAALSRGGGGPRSRRSPLAPRLSGGEA